MLLFDGQPQLPNGLPAGYEQSTIDFIRSTNIPILAIAFTSGGKSSLLYQLAGATNPSGEVISARNATDLLDAYLEALAYLKDRTVINIGNSSAPGASNLKLDAGLAQYISRITFVAGKPANAKIAVKTPGGAPLSTDNSQMVFSYTADPRFNVFTVDAPAPGKWNFEMGGSGTVMLRAILRSRLRIIPIQPDSYAPQGLPLALQASLVEEEPDGKPITLIGQGAFSALITRPDGTQGFNRPTVR